jgi:hypothetical protein
MHKGKLYNYMNFLIRSVALLYRLLRILVYQILILFIGIVFLSLLTQRHELVG